MSSPVPPRAPGSALGGLGAAAALLRDPLAYLRRSHAALGPVFEVRAVTRRMIVIAGREANRFVGREGRTLLESRGFWGRLSERRGCPHAILSVDGEPHSRQRRHYGDVLSRRVVDAQREACDELVRTSFGAGMQRIPIQDQLRLLVARLVHLCLTEGAPPVPEQQARALMEVFRWETNTLLLGKWPRLALRMPAYRRHLATAERFLDALVEAEASTPTLGGWFERIRAGQREHPDLFTPGDVRFAMLLPFVAGVDTVGATASFIIHELFKNPQLRAKVCAEVEAAYTAAGGRAPALAALHEAPTLRGVVLECLRLHPAAFAMYRNARAGFEFAGYEIPAHSELVVFTSATHFDARYFPNPDQLDPERHGSERAETRQKHVFMPYGGGPHVCLGAGMGEAMLLALTASLLHHHALEDPAPEQRFGAVYDPSLTLDPRFELCRLSA